MSALLLIAATAALAQVELRGGARLEDPVERVSIEGVVLAGDAARAIGWDRVKRVEGDHAEASAAYAHIADRAWRARTRLARGDTALALPLFEELFDIYRDLDGPTALVVAEGLLHCRLRRGAQAAAVEPWLAALRLRQSGERLTGEPPLPSVIDEETGLSPALPPIWLGHTGLTTVAGMRIEGDAGSAQEQIARWCAHAAALDLGLSPAPPPTPEHAATRLVADMALSRSPDRAAREAARAALRDALPADTNTWREAWRRAAIGRSLLIETEPDQRRRGVIELMHLPARFADTQPYLVGVALAESALALDQLGDAEAARALRDELRRIDPHHPALLWLEREPASRTL